MPPLRKMVVRELCVLKKVKGYVDDKNVFALYDVSVAEQSFTSTSDLEAWVRNGAVDWLRGVRKIAWGESIDDEVQKTVVERIPETLLDSFDRYSMDIGGGYIDICNADSTSFTQRVLISFGVKSTVVLSDE